MSDNISWALLAAAAPSVVASAVQTGLDVAADDYVLATLMATLGIVARHCHEASKAGEIKLKLLAFDIPTAPMIGIIAFAGCTYFLPLSAPLFTNAIVIAAGFIGPEVVRQAWAMLMDVLASRVRKQP